MSDEDRLRRARGMYEAFAAGDRDELAASITEDFRFSAPPDVGLDRAGYFRRCWPGSGSGRGQTFAFVRLIGAGDVVVVTYEMTRPDGGRGRTPRSSASAGT